MPQAKIPVEYPEPTYWHELAKSQGRTFKIDQVSEEFMPPRHQGSRYWRIAYEGGGMKRSVHYYCDKCLPVWAQREMP